MTAPDSLTTQPPAGEQLTDARREIFETALRDGALVETPFDDGPSLMSITLVRRVIDNTFEADQAIIDPETGLLIGNPELNVPNATVQEDLLAWVRARTGWSPDAHEAWRLNSTRFSYLRTGTAERGIEEIIATHQGNPESLIMVATDR